MSDHPTPAPTQNPLRNPAYPARIHIHEAAHWRGVLKTCEEKVAAAGQKLAALGNSTQRAAYEYLYTQMLGARDQVSEAARRLPGETGGLYAEDHHRLEEAVAALDRVCARWDSLK